MNFEAKVVVVSVCLLTLFHNECAFSQSAAITSAQQQPLIVGYVAGYRNLDFSAIEAKKLTHINYAFANIVDGKAAYEGLTIDGVKLRAADVISMQKLKEKNPDLKVLISIGGWLWSKHFSDVALTDESRRIFAKSCVEFLVAHQLDGIDLDWEYPGQRGAGNKFRPEDRDNFTLLLKTVREHLEAQSDAAGLHPHDRYLLTIAAGANQAYVDNTNLREAHRYLDFINVMCYDFLTGKFTGHHANLFSSDANGGGSISAQDGINRLVEAGVPVEKLVLGVPFYGRKWKGVSSHQAGLYQPSRSTSEFVYYRSLVQCCLNNDSYEKHWDNDAKAPYLWNPTDGIFISYEDEQSLLIKMKWLRQKGMGGVMFWEYSDDVDCVLLNAIHKGLNQ